MNGQELLSDVTTLLKTDPSLIVVTEDLLLIGAIKHLHCSFLYVFMQCTEKRQICLFEITCRSWSNKYIIKCKAEENDRLSNLDLKSLTTINTTFSIVMKRVKYGKEYLLIWTGNSSNNAEFLKLPVT